MSTELSGQLIENIGTQGPWVRTGPRPLHFDHIPQVILTRTRGENHCPVICPHMAMLFIFTCHMPSYGYAVYIYLMKNQAVSNILETL